MGIKDEEMKVDDLVQIMSTSEAKDLKLYFITRSQDSVGKSLRQGRYVYRIYQSDCTEELQERLYDSAIRCVRRLSERKYKAVEYDILSDDTERFLSYSVQGKDGAFLDIVNNQLESEVDKINDISDLSSDNQTPWAFCLEFFSVDMRQKLYTFRKILPSKVGVNNKKSIVRAFFSTTSLQLEIQKEDTINLDEQVDFIFFCDSFYIFEKSSFERVVGLQEEFMEKAKIIIDKMISCGISGGYSLHRLLERGSSMHKKIIKIEKVGGYLDLTQEKVCRMQEISLLYGKELPVKDGKICIEKEEDVETILRVLGDYYKKGEVSGKAYGTYSGKEIKPRR